MNATILLSGILDRNAPLKVVDALLLALIGICIVFCVLIILMLLVQIEGMIFEKSDKLRQKHPEWAQKVIDVKQKMAFWKKNKKEENGATEQKEDAPLANGTCGELRLVNTDERDAAMIMAIVADATQTPLNELRFKSIKRVDAEGEQK